MKLRNGFKKNLVTVFLSWCFVAILLAWTSSASAQQTVVLFQEDFESGIGNWFADNGLWEVGVASSGPAVAHSDSNVAGTVLGGNYPSSANTRFISPEISLPTISGNEKNILKFWNWFSTEDCCDMGTVQITTDGETWIDISTFISGAGLVWTQQMIDISNYAGSTIRIAFFFSSNSGSTIGSGWYIDDVMIENRRFSMPNPEEFEIGIGDWSVDNGLWEVGVPSVGPGSAHSGQNVAGTVLTGNYPSSANSRLISPEILLKRDTTEVFELRFWEWFSTEDCCDKGSIQISVDDGDWQNVQIDPISGSSTVWSQRIVDLTDYMGSLIRIAFYFTSNSGSTVSSGWFIDDIKVRVAFPVKVGEPPQNHAVVSFQLSQNYPNPFNPTTTINYQLPKSAQVVLTIYNLLGQEITKLVNESQSVGEHVVQWDGRDHDGNEVSSGVYLYRLNAGSFHQTSRMLLLR